MEVIDTRLALPPGKGGAVVTIGMFDGLNLEDQRVVAAARDTAAATGLVSATLLFEPHPVRLGDPGVAPFGLMTTEQRWRELDRLGVQRLYLALYSPDLANLSAEDFIRRILRERLDANHVCASSPVLFGRDEEDRSRFLQALREAYGDRFIQVEPEHDSAGDYISSTRVREALRGGDMANAARMLGRPYAIEGPVIHGAKLGRTIGFPTLNIPLGEYLRPALGIYASVSRMADGRRLPGVSYIGTRPTVHGVEELLETFLFDIDESLYGQTVETELVQLLRPDQTFAGLSEMQQQIALDCEAARRVLAGAAATGAPLSKRWASRAA